MKLHLEHVLGPAREEAEKIKKQRKAERQKDAEDKKNNPPESIKERNARINTEVLAKREKRTAEEAIRAEEIRLENEQKRERIF